MTGPNSSSSVTVISSSSSSHEISSSSNTIISINVAAQAPLKLTATNYRSWKLQFHTLLVGFDLVGFVDGQKPCPPATVTTNDIESPNPAHNIWIRQDQLLLNAILGSISPSIIPFITSAKTACDAWTALANTYAKPSRGHIMHLKGVLTNVTKGTQSVTEYMQHIKSVADELAMLDAPENFEDLTVKILNGLGDEFKDISSAVRARDTAISFEELHEKLINFEAVLKQEVAKNQRIPITANYATRPPSNSYHGNSGSQSNRNTQPAAHSNRSSSKPAASHPQSQTSRYSPNNSHKPRNYRGFCQLCGEQGHTAKQCSNFTLSPVQNRAPPNQSPQQWQPRANYAAPSVTSPPEWLLDSGASHHVTTDLNNMSLHSPYSGSDDIMIGDGSGLKITHTSSIHLPSKPSSFLLSNVLYVPNMKQNLISVSQFCATNQVSVEFSPLLFIVKDLRTGARLLQGRTRNGVYEWPSHAQREPPSKIALSCVKATLPDWHHRLGHPSSKIISHLVSSQAFSILSSNKSSVACNACKCNKTHKLLFSVSTVCSSKPLEVIYSDVWSSPIISKDGYKYYVIFVDHFTKYIWLYPLKNKSDVHDVFKRFKLLVEIFFRHPIVSFYSDNGGEFIALKQTLASHGISHFTTPSHTPEHNGVSERRHRHIVETGLSLLTHASMPLTFWSYAFTTAVYLINRMPTPVLNMSTPFEKIFSKRPSYDKLRVFGCLCYPWIKPYNAHKLEPRSRACLFIGYSMSQSA